MRRNWTDHEIMHLGFLIQAGFNNKEIAQILKRERFSVQIQAYQTYGGNPNYQRSIIKHIHLRDPVFRFFLNHTWDETKEKFGLTDRHLKSIFTAGYRDPKLAHLRKDKRTKAPWTADQLQTLLQSAGIRPRNWIAKKLKRGNVQSCIKERLEKLGVSSRTLNGVTMSSYVAMFNKRPRVFLKTDAGPGRGKHAATFFKLIPWYQIEKDFQDKYITTKNSPFRKASKTMCLFQNWIFDGDARKHLKHMEVRDVRT